MGAVEISVLDNAKEAYMLYLLKEVSDTKISDVKFSGGYLKGIDFATKGTPSKVDFYLKDKENAFCIRTDDISAKASVDSLSYSVSKLNIKGSIKYDINKGLSMNQCY